MIARDRRDHSEPESNYLHSKISLAMMRSQSGSATGNTSPHESESNANLFFRSFRKKA